MKTSIALLLALLLMTVFLTACGEDKPSDETVTTTTTEDATTTTALEDTATTTTAKTTTSTTIASTTTTGATTTSKPIAIVSTVDPHGYKDNYYYVGTLQPDGDGLVRPRILFDGEYAVVMHYMYSATKEDDNQQPFEYGGKTYYGQGEGMSPYQFELTATEILVKDPNNGAVIMKLVLLSNGNMKVTATTDNYFPTGLILNPTAQ